MAVVEKDFAQWLRDQLRARGWGVRTLAREINPEKPEIPRRAINHYMRGSRPTEPYAVAIAAALDLDRSEVPVEGDARLGGPFRPGRSGSSGSADGDRPGAQDGSTGEVAA